MTKLLRYEDRKSGIDYYGLSDNEFFKNKKTVVVKENATKQDLLDKKRNSSCAIVRGFNRFSDRGVVRQS